MTVRALPVCPPTLTLAPEATVAEAMSMMIQREVNHIPLCEPGGRFLGLISSNAILRALVPASARVEHGVENLNFVGDALPMLLDHMKGNADRRVVELADASVAPVRMETPLLEAALLLSRTNTPLPVVGDEGRLLGMMSRRMLLTYLLDKSRNG
ncbi:CBS domain-containing protein [Parasulfuritortus cantonensis]|uniref:CBS domain-containing protein n=1 Tax=Parasulfuritortus cantonensis TaxID=2528202 RepID=A0A4R1BGK8_9PROT|nr:CBS domain-containing protein [Parasulfuritortus cantonensis]TCJ16366.1 CBS domain-containing protein [Parasulfuritortus cantonensis]